MNRRILLFGCVVWAALLSPGCSRPTPKPTVGEWRQFRGPGGLGISVETDLPVRWGPDSANIRWRAPVPGSGNSSPIVSRGRLFLTTVYGNPEDNWGQAERRREPKRVVLAYDLATGKRLWETVVFEGRAGKKHWDNTHATPTPVTDGRHVFVSFDAHLAALDFDGNIVWHRDVDPYYYEESHYGVASSPVVADGRLILLQDREKGDSGDPGWIAAFDKSNGEEAWRDEWMHTCCSYSTPLVVERGGRLEVWNQTALEVVAYDARSGKKLWRAEHPSTQTVPSLVRQGDLFSTPGGMHTQSIEMFDLSERDGQGDPLRIWSSRRGAPEISSPVLYRDKMFTVSRVGVLFVREAQTGEVLSRRRLRYGAYVASLVAGDGKVYVVNGEGLTTVIDAAGETPRVLTHNRLAGGSGASPAIADGSLFLRTKGGLFRIDRRRAVNAAQESEPAAQADSGGKDI
ncbi:MAG: PQQ-binding-like beta-propeller repeat protein [Thermoanaerobaculia bacterium]